MSTDVATNQSQGSDQKSDTNKQQDQAGSGTEDPKQINGKNVVGKCTFFICFFFFLFFCALPTKEKRKKNKNFTKNSNKIAVF